jgi:tetratricopeptide (TPR) repeat protein
MASIPLTRPGRPHRRVSPRPFRPLLLLSAALLVVSMTYLLGRFAAPAAPAIGQSASTQGADDALGQIDQAIGVWSANLARDDADFVSATNLADLYYSRARLTGNVDDYSRASEAVGLSLKAYPEAVGAQQLSAQLLFATHDFQGALVAARAIFAAHPDQLAALATVADAQLELGQYANAARTLATLAVQSPGAAITGRQAHLAALIGKNALAATLAQRAIGQVTTAGGTPTDRSWYEYLAGYLAFQAGDLSSAEGQFRAAIDDWPGSYLATAGLARTRAAQGASDEAITLYQKAIAIVPQPEFLAALGDLYALRGDATLASAQYDLVQAIAHLASVQAQVYNRQLVLFDANHGQDLPNALALARRELATRHDVYGWDAYAWALYANGRYADAEVAMRSARAQHTVDPLLDYHAGMIAAALGHNSDARQLLSVALATNPGFDPLQASRARHELAMLGQGGWAR